MTDSAAETTEVGRANALSRGRAAVRRGVAMARPVKGRFDACRTAVGRTIAARETHESPAAPQRT